MYNIIWLHSTVLHRFIFFLVLLNSSVNFLSMFMPFSITQCILYGLFIKAEVSNWWSQVHGHLNNGYTIEEMTLFSPLKMPFYKTVREGWVLCQVLVRSSSCSHNLYNIMTSIVTLYPKINHSHYDPLSDFLHPQFHFLTLIILDNERNWYFLYMILHSAVTYFSLPPLHFYVIIISILCIKDSQ